MLRWYDLILPFASAFAYVLIFAFKPFNFSQQIQASQWQVALVENQSFKEF